MSEGLIYLFSPPALAAGETLYRQSAVAVVAQIVAPNRVRGWVKAKVRGIGCELNWIGASLVADCRCGASTRTRQPLCEHIWATVLWASGRGLLSPEVASRLPARLQGDRPATAEQKPPAWLLRLQEADKRFTPTHERAEDHAIRAALKPGEAVAYILSRAYRDDLLTVQVQRRRPTRKGWWSFTNLRVTPELVSALPPGDDANLLAMLCGVGDQDRPWGGHGAAFGLTSREAARLVPRFCATGRCYAQLDADEDEDPQGPLSWEDGEAWQLELAFAKTDAGHRMMLCARQGAQRHTLSAGLILSEELFVRGTQLCRLENERLSYWRRVAGNDSSGDTLTIGKGEWGGLAAGLAARPGLPQVDWPAESEIQQELATFTPVAKLGPAFGAKENDVFSIAVEFDYGGGHMAAAGAAFGAFYDRARKTQWRRDARRERQRLQELLEIDCLKSQQARTVLARNVPVLVERLTSLGWRVMGEKVTYRPAGEMRLEVKSGIDWFDLEGSASFGSVSLPLPRVLEALKSGRRQVELGEGEVGVLPERWLKEYGLLLGTGKASETGVRFSRAQSPLLASLLQESPQVHWDPRFAELRAGLASFRGIEPADAPGGFQGELRPYQREGLGWLRFLRQFGLGGCLADDMGLGKTVQVLAMLEERRERSAANGEARRPSLVVAPKSVIFNWKQETARFAPRLRVLDYTGTARRSESLPDADLILTTYGTLRNDARALAEVQFDYVILDESQAIKNASTASAHAARLLKADHRLALSGTPIENHLRELWSLFEFLNPGMLGVASVFRTAMSDMDAQRLEVLSRALRPFILRRTKEQVATELPPCVEQTLYCELEGEQRRLYEELREHYRTALLSQGGVAGRMQVLEALLRLRQASCHAGLLDESQQSAGSAKTELLMEKLLPAAAEGHKALVFSQFTSLLSLVRGELDARKVPYAYLDGQTVDRQRVVEQFQNDASCRVFLISLKAGGVGLNLTAAEYVFLLDPWWNPAVESQAIDRAHRIGQTRRVIAYRLIAKDTVEEKVLLLQEKKRQLADAILSAEGSLLSELSREDLELLLS